MMRCSNHSIQIGITGLGGYARTITDLILKYGDKVQPTVRLVAVCDPQSASFPDRLAELTDRGVALADSFEQMLADDAIQAVWLPLPIGLHASFTQQALAAGKAVMCEKPAAATVDEVDAMIAARDAAGLPALIGFQDMYEPSILTLKRQLVGGAFGKVRRVTVRGCRTRGEAYFNRSPWAGRIQHNDQWILDSPPQNAMSHPVNLALFLLGSDVMSSARPSSVEAELYRAAPIENYDTLSAHATFDNDAELLILMTHACDDRNEFELHLEAENGEIQWTNRTITWRIGDMTGQAGPEQVRGLNVLRQFAAVMAGKPAPNMGMGTLEITRMHTLLINGISEATPVYLVPAEHVYETTWRDSKVHAITGIEAAMQACANDFQMLHASGRLPFTQPAGQIDLRDYCHFNGPPAASIDRFPARR